MKDVCNVTLLYGIHLSEDDEYKYDDCYQITDTPYMVIKKYNTFDKEHVYIALCYSAYDEYGMDTCCGEDRLLEEPSQEAVKKFKIFCKEKGLGGECGHYVAFEYR